jgi:hypothetical protein
MRACAVNYRLFGPQARQQMGGYVSDRDPTHASSRTPRAGNVRLGHACAVVRGRGAEGGSIQCHQTMTDATETGFDSPSAALSVDLSKLRVPVRAPGCLGRTPNFAGRCRRLPSRAPARSLRPTYSRVRGPMAPATPVLPSPRRHKWSRGPPSWLGTSSPSTTNRKW